ncbi:MAG: hypothetical protein PHI73_00605 [Patescibacteria group bacterium]|nr:hypothetical protein [Patescibacteria group bacterium]
MPSLEQGGVPGPEQLDQKPTFEGLLQEAGTGLEKIDPEEKPFPGASIFNALQQAESFTADAGRIEEITSRKAALTGQFEQLTDSTAREQIAAEVKTELTDWHARLQNPTESEVK